jgi:hypothetical protein
MKYLQAKTNLRSLVAMLVTVAVIGLSALAAQAPAPKQNSVGSLKNIRTKNSMFFYADFKPSCARFVEMMPGLTAQDALASEHLKLVAAAL